MPESRDPPPAPPGDPGAASGEPAAAEPSAAEPSVRGVARPRAKAAAAARPIAHRRALLIGIAEYQSDEVFHRLKYPSNDVRSLASLLLGYGYSSVECLSDEAADAQMQPSRSNIQRALQKLCAQSKADDLIWVHFSCHGMRWSDDGRTARLLITQDTRAAEILATALDLDRDIIAVLNSCPARQKILSLDACQLGYGRAALSISQESRPREYDLAEGMAVLAASKGQEYASESKEAQMGIFTASLIKVLRAAVERERVAELDKVARGVLLEVETWYKTQNLLPQQPTYRFEGLGVLLLVDRRPRVEPTPEPAPQPGPGPGSLPPVEPPPFQILDYTGLTERARNKVGIIYQARTSRALDKRELDVIVTVLHKEFSAKQSDSLLYKDRLAAVRKLTNLRRSGRNQPAPVLGIPRVLGQGETSLNQSYFAVEYITGKRLTKELKSGFSPSAVITFGAQLCRTLLAAHEVGVVHGDLRPERIICTPEQPYILELVIAALDVKLHLLQEPEGERSPYWPPELVPGAALPTESADVFATGVILKEMLDSGAPGGVFKPDSAEERALCRLIDKMRAPHRPQMRYVVQTLERLAGGKKGRGWQIPAMAASLSAVLFGAAWIIKKPPGPIKNSVDMGTPAADLGQKAAQLTDSYTVACEVVGAAITSYKRKGPPSASQAYLSYLAIQELGWLHNDLFGEALLAVLRDGSARDDVRDQAARALGRMGTLAAVPVIEKLLSERGLSSALWQSCLSTLALLSPERLRVAGKQYLHTKEEPQKQLAAAVLLSAFEEEAELVLNQRREQLGRLPPTQESLAAELDVLLGLSWALDDRARQALADKLAADGKGTSRQVGLALKLVERGDPTAIPILRQFVLGKPASESADVAQSAMRLLSHVDPSAEKCSRFAQLISMPPTTDRASYFDALAGIPSCRQAAAYRKQLEALLPQTSADFSTKSVREEQIVQVYAAIALLRVLQAEEEASFAQLQKSVGVADPLYAARPQRDSKQQDRWQSWLLAQLELYSKIALDAGAPTAGRRVAARRVLVIAQANDAQPRPGGARPATSAQPAVERRLKEVDQQLQQRCGSTNPDERTVCALASRDTKLLADALDKEDKPEVQLALAERVHSPAAEKVLRRTAAGSGVAAVRAYSTLVKRQLPDAVPPKNVNLLALYQKTRDADERVELIESLRGLSLDEVRPVLALATQDGAVEVRRSTAWVLGELLAKRDSTQEEAALKLVHLMFQDNDSIVQKRIRNTLARLDRAPSEVPEAPQWPPPPVKPQKPTTVVTTTESATPQTCSVMLRADDAGVEATLGSHLVKLPVTRSLPPGSYKLSYADDKGAVKEQSFQCSGGKTIPVAVPVSQAGQLLGSAIKDIEANTGQDAIKKLTRVQNAAPPPSARTDREAAARWQDVLGRSAYYLGTLYYMRNNPEDAHTDLDKFLHSVAAKNNAELQRKAADKVQRLEKVLGRFAVKQLVNGVCQMTDIWVVPKPPSQDVKVGKYFEPGVVIHANKTVFGKHQCQ